MFQCKNKFARVGTDLKLYIEAVKKEIRCMVHEEMKPIHEHVDRIVKAHVKQVETSSNVRTSAQSTQFDLFDRRFDEFTARVENIIIPLQKKPTSLVDDAQDTSMKNLEETATSEPGRNQCSQVEDSIHQ